VRRFVLLILMASAVPAAAEIAWQPRGLVEIGVDSFAQIFRLTDEVSLNLTSEESVLRTETDVYTELRGAGQLGLAIGDSRNGGDLRARLSYGTDTIRANALARMHVRDSRQRFDAEVEIDGRRFRDDSDLTLSSDFGEVRTRAHWRRTVNESWELGLRAQGEMTRYEQQSLFEIDNERVDVSVTSELRSDLDHWLDLEAGIGRRWAVDYTDPENPEAVASILAYDRFTGLAQWVFDGGGRWRTSLSHWIERRDYEDEAQRSSLWNLVVEPEVRLRLDEDWDLRWRTAIEWLDYDTSSSTYYDIALGRTGMALTRRWRNYEWGVEPRVGWLGTPVPNEDEYLQPSVVFSFDGFGERFFISIQEEIGHRDYRTLATADALGLYSDYWFLRSTILASVTVYRDTSLEFFLSDEPESHRSEEDDSRLTLVSATLRVSF